MITGKCRGIEFEINDGEVKCKDEKLKVEIKMLIDFVCRGWQPYQGDAEYKIAEMLKSPNCSVEYKNTEQDLVY